MEGSMENWLDGVRRILARAPTGTLAFSELLEALSMEGLGPIPDPGWLLESVAKRADLFRVVSLARGPWSYWRVAAKPGGDPLKSRPGQDDPWIILLPTPEAGFGPGEQAMRRVREGLVAWVRHLDDPSPASVARWMRACREGSRAWKVLVNPEISRV
jgi:hypothetical protein